MTRYSLHEIVRQYAAEQLAANSADQAATEARHTAFYVALLQQARTHQFGAPGADGAGPLYELENLRGVWWRAAQNGDRATLFAMARGLWAMYIDRGWLHDGAGLFRGALERIEHSSAAGDVELRGFLLEQFSYFLVRTGRLGDTRAVLAEAQHCYDLAGKTDGLQMIYFNLGIAEMHEGRVLDARSHLLHALELARNAGDWVVAALVGMFLGSASKVNGLIGESEGYLLDALELCRQYGFTRVEHLCRMQLGELLYYQRRFDDAAVPIHDALAYAGIHRDNWMLSMAMSFLAAIALHTGSIQEAGYLFAEAIAGLRAVGDIWSLGRMLTGQAHVALAGNNSAAARRACAEQLQIVQAGEELIKLEAAFTMARIQQFEGRLVEALALAQACEPLPGDYDIHCRAAALQAELAAQLNADQQAQAETLSRRALVPWLAELLARLPQERSRPAPAPPRAELAGNGALLVPETGETLSPREVEVLRLLMAGASNAAIADTLIISLFTVKNHVTNILQKLRVATRTQAAMQGTALGLAPLPARSPK